MATQLHNRFSDEQIKELLSIILKEKLQENTYKTFYKLKSPAFLC